MKAWIKLYTEILQDPKMGRLSDRQYRTCVNLFLLAGQLDCEGALPTLNDVAWYLRSEPQELQADMSALTSAGILTLDGDGWVVTRFAERQARNPSETPEEVKRRVDAYRQRKAAECNGDVTASNVAVTPSNDIEERRIEENRGEEEKSAAVCAALQPTPPLPPREHDPVLPVEHKRHKLPTGEEPSPAVKEYLFACEAIGKPQNAMPPVRAQIDAAVKPNKLKAWRESCDKWLLHGYNPGNVAGLLDYFTTGGNGKARASPGVRRGGEWTAEELAQGRAEDDTTSWPEPLTNAA